MTSADDLLRSVQGGDPDYDGIYRAYGRLMYVAALRAYHQNNRVVDAQDVGDVVHEAFLQVMERKLLTPDTKSIGGLLSTVAYRRALDHLRRGDRHADLVLDDLAGHAGVEDPYAAIEDELERTQIGAAVWDNWHRLNAQERAVFRGVIFEGRSRTELAVELGVSRERVGQVLRAALREMTRGCGDSPPADARSFNRRPRRLDRPCRQPSLNWQVFSLMWRRPAGGSLIWEVVHMTDQQPPLGKQDLRDQAIARLKQKRDFGAHLLVYLLVNAFLLAIWAFTGAGFFWPVFLLFGWGIGLAFNAWDVYWRRPPSEERIRREMERMQ